MVPCQDTLPFSVIVMVDGAEQPLIGCHPEASKGAECTKAVQPGELFALVAAASVVADRDLGDPVAKSQDARRYVGLDVKARALQVEPAPQVGAQRLISALHVRDVAIE